MLVVVARRVVRGLAWARLGYPEDATSPTTEPAASTPWTARASSAREAHVQRVYQRGRGVPLAAWKMGKAKHIAHSSCMQAKLLTGCLFADSGSPAEGTREYRGSGRLQCGLPSHSPDPFIRWLGRGAAEPIGAVHLPIRWPPPGHSPRSVRNGGTTQLVAGRRLSVPVLGDKRYWGHIRGDTCTCRSRATSTWACNKVVLASGLPRKAVCHILLHDRYALYSGPDADTPFVHAARARVKVDSPLKFAAAAVALPNFS